LLHCVAGVRHLF